MKRHFCIYSIFLFALIFFSCSKNPPETNKELKIRFIPRENWESKITFIDDLNSYKNRLLIEQIEKARMVGVSFIPKEKTSEGEYELLIYENDVCIETYNILNTDYLFDTQRECYLKSPDILNKIRAEFYLRLIRKNNK